jgi:hypothetical protein
LGQPATGTTRSAFALRLGMLLGLAILAAAIVGLVQLSDLKSHLGAMSPDANQGWLSYEFMNKYLVALSLAWTSLCVAVPTAWLARRRQWRRLAGMLAVAGVGLLVLLGFELYAAALSNGLRAVTG